MQSPPCIDLHIGDYKRDTGHLRAAGHGGYLLLMMHYWANGGLPNDDQQLAAIACMTDREWQHHKPMLKALFKAGEWKHKRIEEDLAKAEDKFKRRSRAGRNGNATRWGSQNRRNATDEGSQCDPNVIANPSPPTSYFPEGGGDRGDARAREPLISPEAHSLAVEVAGIAGYPDPQAWPPGWCGAPLRVQSWVSEGWPRDVVLAAVREAMAKKRDGPPGSIKYFETAIARAIAQHNQPLPKVQVIEGATETIHAQGHSGSNRSPTGRSHSARALEFARRVATATGEPGDGQHDPAAPVGPLDSR